MQQNNMEHKLNFLLMGKAGDGKSATGNSLLKRKYFKTCSDATSKAGEVDFNFAQFENNFLTVVDGLRVGNIGKSTDTISSMETALDMCYEGIDVFLFVMKFGNRFTAEDKLAFDALTHIFGYSFVDNVIVVVTYGDHFKKDMEEERRNIDFQEWCREQTGDFRRLFDDCRGRFVLINNSEKNEVKKSAQIQAIVQLAQHLQSKYGPYTRLCFQNAEGVRQKIILEENALRTPQNVHDKLDLFKTNIKQNHQGVMKFVIIGNIGTGKSATGNSLLNKHVFKTSVFSVPQTLKAEFDLTQSGNEMIMVVDTPGLSGFFWPRAQYTETAIKHMETVIKMCYGGIDAFLFVIKFGKILQIDSILLLSFLKRILGDRFMYHVIVVVTHGDNFEKEMERKWCKDSYHEWLSKVNGELGLLYDNCQKRFVLFNNTDGNEKKKQAQIQEIIKLTYSLRDTKGRYSSQCFKDAEKERKKMLAESLSIDSRCSLHSSFSEERLVSY